MAIRVEIIGETIAGVREQMLVMLGLPAKLGFVLPPEVPPEVPAEIAEEEVTLEVLARHAYRKHGSDETTPEQPTEGLSDKPLRKRGRPRKNADAAGSMPADAQPAVADNTGSPAALALSSPQPVAGPAPPVAVSPPPATATGASSMDAAAFRVRLQAIASSVEGGFDKLKRTLDAHGFKYVRDVPPDAYALIVRDAELLA